MAIRGRGGDTPTVIPVRAGSNVAQPDSSPIRGRMTGGEVTLCIHPSPGEGARLPPHAESSPRPMPRAKGGPRSPVPFGLPDIGRLFDGSLPDSKLYHAAGGVFPGCRCRCGESEGCTPRVHAPRFNRRPGSRYSPLRQHQSPAHSLPGPWAAPSGSADTVHRAPAVRAQLLHLQREKFPVRQLIPVPSAHQLGASVMPFPGMTR